MHSSIHFTTQTVYLHSLGPGNTKHIPNFWDTQISMVPGESVKNPLLIMSSAREGKKGSITGQGLKAAEVGDKGEPGGGLF